MFNPNLITSFLISGIAEKINDKILKEFSADLLNYIQNKYPTLATQIKTSSKNKYLGNNNIIIKKLEIKSEDDETLAGLIKKLDKELVKKNMTVELLVKDISNSKVITGDDRRTIKTHFGSDNIVGKYILTNEDVVKKKRLLGRAELIRPITTFTGRKKDLKVIESILSQNRGVLLLTGLGGIGKTELAKQYVVGHLQKYDHVCWIDYQKSLQESFITQIDHSYDPKEFRPEELYKKIISDLNNLKGNNVLVIDGFDNMEDEENIASLPISFKTLIISRYALESDIMQVYRLDTLPKSAAKKLFVKCWHSLRDEDQENQIEAALKKLTSNENDDLEKLLEKIGYHTLAIEIVARTMAKTEITLKDMLQLRGSIHVHTSHPKATTTATNEFLTQVFDLADISQKAIPLLQNFAVLPSIDIKQEIIIDLLQITNEKQNEFIELLHDTATRGWLMRTTKEENGRQINLFRCHQIIQTFINNIDVYKPTFETFRKCIESLIKNLQMNPGDNPLEKTQWLIYAIPLLEHIQDEKSEIAQLAYLAAWIYREIGNSSQALEYTKKALEIYKNRFQNHPNLAALYNNLSFIYKDMGDFSQATEYSKKALKIREMMLDANHPNLAISYNNIAAIYQDMGDLPKALEFAQKALRMREQVFATNHPDLATSYNNLALIYQDMGDLPKALEYAKRALEIREQVLATNHPSLATSYNNLATIYYNKMDYTKAKEYIEKAIIIWEWNFPNGYPSLDNARKWLKLTEGKLQG